VNGQPFYSTTISCETGPRPQAFVAATRTYPRNPGATGDDTEVAAPTSPLKKVELPGDGPACTM
jgi:hypothetical protein